MKHLVQWKTKEASEYGRSIYSFHYDASPLAFYKTFPHTNMLIKEAK